MHVSVVPDRSRKDDRWGSEVSVGDFDYKIDRDRIECKLIDLIPECLFDDKI